MRYILTGLLIVLLSSCSVKKKVVSQKKETSVTVERRDTVVVNSEMNQIEVVVQDTLKPVSITFVSPSRPPVTKTFTNVRSVKLSKKTSNEVRVTDQTVESTVSEVLKQRDVQKNNYLWAILILAGIWLLSTLRLRR
jgi:hypothetical protein